MKTIPLTKGYFTKVDDADYNKFAIFRWYADASRPNEIRAVRSVNESGKIRRITLSREIMGVTGKLVVDHINRDTLDNRRDNLRICSQAENCKNRREQKNGSSKFKGVYLMKKGNYKKWAARITVDGKSCFLGCFSNELEAAKAYNLAAKKHFKKFAYLNKI